MGDVQISRTGYLEPVENSKLISKLCRRKMGVLYGIFTVARKSEIRSVARSQSKCDLNNENHSTIFVVGRPGNKKDHEIIARESLEYGDIFVLTCEENMNSGKSFFYFKEALEQLPCFDFYAKVDDDTAFAPNLISAKTLAMQDITPLFIGRSKKNNDGNFFTYAYKLFRHSFNPMPWIYSLDNYTVGMMYILNSQAIRTWMLLDKKLIHGDEDQMTSYYMNQIGARVIDLDISFHDYIGYRTLPFVEHWRRNITHNTLAVHQCKSVVNLMDAFMSVCAEHAMDEGQVTMQ
jgi:hypothetical protein